jgi:chromosome segregation protein
MFVKSLRLAGFKSFANPTVLEFQAGVNVIVGPNGSGKSNIADALSWVLGSQAPSSLRGASMEDVIFAGSAGRSRLGIAEVELTLDNASRVLPLDLSEVSISRSTDRAGTSEYKINGAPCRLLDIAELLSDTGIGRSIHTVVGQGQLDAVLQARPEDRRAFIEEAAQIGKYRRRKDRSLRKIERVDDNLTRLNDVISELRRAIRPLKRQASAASMYTEMMAEHRELRQRLTGSEVRRLTSIENSSDQEADRHHTQLLDEELSTLRARLQGAQGERDELALRAEAARTTAHRMARAADRLTGLGKLAAERAEKIAARLAAETEEGYRERIRLLEADRVRWGAEAEALGATATTARTRADEAQNAAEVSRRLVEEAERVVAKARTDETEAAQALVRAEGSEAAGRATLGSVEARVHAVVERREVTERTLRQDAEAIEKTEQEVRTIEAELDRVTEAAAAAETVLEEARARADALRDSVGASHANAAAAKARVETLDEVRALFSDRPDVLERIAPLERLAAERAQVSGLDEEDARKVLSEAERTAESHWQQVAKLDEELRRLDALMSGTAERLAGTRRKREAREVELAALDDELARTREALATAERVAAEERAALPERRAILEQARRTHEAAEREITEAREQLRAQQLKMQEAEINAREAEQKHLAAQLRLEEAEAGIGDAEEALAGLADRRSGLQEQQERAVALAEVAVIGARDAEKLAAEAEQEAVSTRAELDEGERQLSQMRARERDLSERLEEVARRRNEAEIRRAEVRARMESLAERAMDEWGLGLDALGRLEPFSEEDEPGARTRAEELDKQMKRMGVINPRAAEEYEELAERERFLVEQIEDLKSSRRDLMKVVHEIDETIVQVFGEAFEQVAQEFQGVFQRLFPGGSGGIKLTDPDDLLGSGIEIEARPPGKNVRKLSLLSGGERSLVALAFLFSIFRSHPSPFYLLDEVEAALDDFNLQRFIGLVHELEERAQILIVTHQKRTMETADVLYGVSMAKDGVSQVVAKRMPQAEPASR